MNMNRFLEPHPIFLKKNPNIIEGANNFGSSCTDKVVPLSVTTH